jgi:serralysin
MKNFLLLVIFALSTSLVWGQNSLEQKEKARMSGNNVKKQTQWAYDYVSGKPVSNGYISCMTSFDKAGNTTEIINYKTDGKITSILNYTYDSKGNKTSYTRYQGNREKLTYSQKISYDSNNNKLSETGFDGSGNYSNAFSYVNGKLSSIKYTTDNLVTEKRSFKYNGTQTEISIYSPDDKIIAKEVNIYDVKNNLIEEARYANKDVTQKKQYQYDPKGLVVEETKHQFGNLAYKKKYTYDNKGNLMQVEDIKPDGKSAVTNTYAYDSKGNILEERWRKDSGSEESFKKYTYNEKGLYTAMDCFFASYKFSVLYKFTYENY